MRKFDQSTYERVLDRIRYTQGLYEGKKQQRDRVQVEVEYLSKEKILLTKTEKVLKHLIDKLIQKDLSKMDALVTYGLNTVFPERDISFRSSVEERGKKIHVHLKTFYQDKEVSSESRSSVSVIESVLLRILSIVKLKKTKFIYMDESFSAVHVSYIDNVSRLLAQVCEKLGLDLLLVTHNPLFSEYVHNSFQLKLVNDKIEIEKIK